MAKDEVLSYSELKSLDVFEFFLILVNYEKNARNRPTHKPKQRSGGD